MQQLCIFDTSLGSPNLGDQIIMESIYEVVAELHSGSAWSVVPTHYPMASEERRAALNSDLRLVGGTNLLKRWMFVRPQWKLTTRDYLRLHDVVLFGCGWRNYQPGPSWPTRMALGRLLSRRWVHSVRDEYTRQQLIDAGVTNVQNTACPTMWALSPEHCAGIPMHRAQTCIFTLTAYARSPELDRAMVKMIQSRYTDLAFFAQQPDDLRYLQELDVGFVRTLPPTLRAYEAFLRAHATDYIGTRLHGGIFALRHGRRSLIVSIDNRAAELGRDTGLPVLRRDDLDGMKAWIGGSVPVAVRLPSAAIAAWKRQFSQDQPADVRSAAADPPGRRIHAVMAR